MNLKNKTIQLIILMVILCLIGGYLYYDCQRYQTLEKELGEKITALELQLANLRKEAMGVGDSSLFEPEATEFTTLEGIIKKIEDEVIILEGQTASSSENKEYRIAVNSKTNIQKQGQEIELENLEEGNIISVLGKANPFNKQEVLAEMILVFQ